MGLNVNNRQDRGCFVMSMLSCVIRCSYEYCGFPLESKDIMILNW